MTMVKPANPFILPLRTNPDNLEDEYDRKKFKQWISDLPIGDVGKIARSLHHEINRQNRLEMSPVERLDAIQLMLPTLGYVLSKLSVHFSGRPVPLSKENRLIARLHLELLVNVVVAYKTVLAQFHDDSFTGYLLHKRGRSEAVRHALYFLGEILLHTYSIYRATPRFVWKEMHGFYYYAVTNELQRKETEDSDDFVGHMTIDDIYKRSLLLALADPNSLLRGEANKVNEILETWLSETELVPAAEGISSPAFVVDATKDAPPYVAGVDAIKQIKIGWILHADKLVGILEKEIDKISANSGGRLRPVELVTTTLYLKLHKRWGHDAVDREERTDGVGTVEAVCGLEALHRLFGGWRLQQEIKDDIDKSPEPDPIEKRFGQSAHVIEQDEFIIEADAKLFAAIAAGPEDKEDQEELEQDFYNAVVDGEPRAEECSCVNRSNGGCHLIWPEQSEYKAHVGELVAINSGVDKDSWRMGIIRWMRTQANDIMGFGVELFAGDVEAIKLDYRLNRDSPTNTMLGFRQRLNGGITNVITRPFFFGDNNKFVITGIDGRTNIVAGEITECTDAFMQFRVTADAEAVTTAKEETNKDSGAEDIFNSIWEDL